MEIQKLHYGHTQQLVFKPIFDIIKDHPEYKMEDLEEIYVNVRDAAYHIIERKRATYYGIGMCTTRIVRAILNDENSVLPVSVYLDGNTDFMISLPECQLLLTVTEFVKYSI